MPQPRPSSSDSAVSARNKGSTPSRSIAPDTATLPRAERSARIRAIAASHKNAGIPFAVLNCGQTISPSDGRAEIEARRVRPK